MTDRYAIEVEGLHRSYGRRSALQGLDLQVEKGQFHGLFGRNGAGKTTLLKCLLHQLRPSRGQVRIFNMDPAVRDVDVKARIGYVPDEANFYPWMTVRNTLDYMASFRAHWNRDLEAELVHERFKLSEKQRVRNLSKGMRMQLALICALCPEPELLILDEPTSGLDPVVRREFIETVIGAYQTDGPEPRTLLVSTHLIEEFEGLIDAFTIIDRGRQIVTVTSDEARRRFKKVLLLFDDTPPTVSEPFILTSEPFGRELQLTVRGFSPDVERQLRGYSPISMQTEDLSMEDIFIASTGGRG